MHTDPTHIAICAEYATRQPGLPVGPCVLRPQHQGRTHQDVRGTQWSTPAPAAGGVVEDALAVAGETSTGCFIPPRTPAGQRTRTRLGTPDTRVQAGPDTGATREDTVQAAINRTFGIRAETTPDTAGPDGTRTRSALVRADTGRWDSPHMQTFIAAQHEKALRLLAEAYAEREQLLARVRELSEELGRYGRTA